MRDSLCRVTVCAPRSSAPAVDVSLPADCPVGTLLTELVDVVGPCTDGGPRRWHLSHLTGGTLDTSNSLRDNGVEDGDVLVLDATGIPSPRRSPVDAALLVAGSARPHAVLPSPLLDAAGLAVVAVLAVALAWPGGSETRLWCAAALAAAAALIVAADRRCPLPSTLGVAAAVFAAVTGYLAFPGGSWQVAVVFAAAAGCAMSTLLGRVTASTVHVAISAAAAVVAAAGVVSATASSSAGAAGAVLALCSVAALTAAPRIVISAAGLSPTRDVVEPERAGWAHRLLTGLVVGWSASAALGIVALAVPGGVAAVALAADVGILLALRSRHHSDPARRIALGAAGLVGCAAAWVGTTVLWPGQLHWLCAGAALTGVASTYQRQRGRELSPVARQVVQMLEYAALVAVVPLALWVAGVYGWARGLAPW